MRKQKSDETKQFKFSYYHIQLKKSVNFASMGKPVAVAMS